MSGSEPYVILFQFDAYQGVHSPTHMLMSVPGGSGVLQPTNQVRGAPQDLTAGSRDLSIGYVMETGNMLTGVSRSPRSADPHAQSVPPEAASSPYGICPGMPSFRAPLQFGSIPAPAPLVPPPIIHTASHEEDADHVRLEPANDTTRPQSVAHSAASTRTPEVAAHAPTHVCLVPPTRPPPSRCATRAFSAASYFPSPSPAPAPVQSPILLSHKQPTPVRISS